ncbi:MAG: DUF116 domain-containing protein [Promethearchaeota archaeon]
MTASTMVGEILASIKRKAEEMGCTEKELLREYIQQLNAGNRTRFAREPFSKRILLLPQCLREPDCSAPQTEEGYICQQCNPDCQVNRLSQEAKRLGYKGSYILPGGSMIARVIAATQPSAVIGISCEKEALLGILTLEDYGIVAIAVLLARDGCYNTAVDLEEALATLALTK